MTKAMFLEFPGRRLPIAVKRSGVARRMSLRLDPGGAGVVVVLPVGVPVSEAHRFAARQRDWIASRLEAQPARLPFLPGARVPLLGEPHTVCHVPLARRGVWLDAGTIMVSGMAEHVERRVADFLRAEARRHLSPHCHRMAAELGRKLRRISIRDTRSRWGSCTAAGDLAFCWRLVMAPEGVLAYVAAHEVAHLAELNHGPRFWDCVETLLGADPAPPRAWLKAHGAELHRYG